MGGVHIKTALAEEHCHQLPGNQRPLTINYSQLTSKRKPRILVVRKSPMPRVMKGTAQREPVLQLREAHGQSTAVDNDCNARVGTGGAGGEVIKLGN